MRFNIYYDVKMKWWVKPLIKMAKAAVFITRCDLDVDRFADFIAKHGIKTNLSTKAAG